MREIRGLAPLITYGSGESALQMIHVSSLTKTYDDLQRGRFVAVDGVSFRVRPGEIFGLLGPNGAGKTTVLRILSTVLKPTSGTASILGYDCVEDAANVRASIGFVSNNTAIYDRMTAWEMVEYFGRLHGMPKKQLAERMHQLFGQLRMDPFREVPCGKLSTGMKQKVSIARALIHDPPVLVFDEATLGLDVLVARNLLDVIRQLRDAGKCLVFSTHIMREVERLCDSIAIMHQGRILDMGSLEELRNRHAEEDFEELFFGLLSQHDEQAQQDIADRWIAVAANPRAANPGAANPGAANPGAANPGAGPEASDAGAKMSDADSGDPGSEDRICFPDNAAASKTGEYS